MLSLMLDSFMQGTEAHPPTEPASKDFGTGLRLATDVIDMHGDISNSTDDDAGV